MASNESRGKSGKCRKTPANAAPASPNEEASTQADTSSSNAQLQSSQANAVRSQASSQLPSPVMRPTRPSRSAIGTQPSENCSPNVLTIHTLGSIPPRHAESSPPRTVPGKLGPERLTLRHNASGVSLRRDYIVPSSLSDIVKQPWEKGDSGGEGEHDVSAGSRWVKRGCSEGENLEKAMAGNHGRDIGLCTSDTAAENPEKDVHITKHYRAPPLYTQYQHSSSHSLDRGYSFLSAKASPQHHQTTSPSPLFPHLPSHMSAFEYAIRPFLDNNSTHHDPNLALPSPTTDSLTSSAPSVSSQPPSAAHSSWSPHTEQLYEAPLLEQGFSEFMKGAKTLENRVRLFTLNTILLRCAVLSRLIESSRDVAVTLPSPVGSAGGLHVLFTSRSRSRGRSRPRPGSRTNNRLSLSRCRSDTSGSDSDNETKLENYEAWSKVYTLAQSIAYPMAQRLGHQVLQARCSYWVGRAEWGMGDWENARKAFERVDLHGADGLRSDEMDWRFWLSKVRDRYLADDGSAIDTNVEDSDDGNEGLRHEDDQEKDFEDWERDYITKGVLRKYRAAHRRKTRQIRHRVIPDVVSPTSRHLSPLSTRDPYDRYQEHAFSPWDQILGSGRENSPPRENLSDILKKDGEQGKQ